MESKKKTKIIWITVAVLLLILAGVYAYITYMYWDKFLMNTFADEFNISKLTLAEAEELFEQKTDAYKLSINFREDKTEDITAPDIDFKYNSENGLKKAFDSQSPFSWPIVMVNGAMFTVESGFSEEKLDSKLDSMTEFDKKKMTKPKDAYVACNAEGFYIEPEVMGTKLDVDAAKAAVSAAVTKTMTSVDLEENYINPKLYRDDKGLAAELDNLKELLPTTVTYTLPDGSEKLLDGQEMINWLVKDEKTGKYSKDETKWTESISTYVTQLAQSTDTVYKEHKFHTNKNTEIMLRATGYYGWKIWQDKEAEQLAEDLASGTNVKREPVYSMREAAAPSDNNGFGDSYIEIDLERQHLWVYQDGKEVFDTAVVSGKNTEDRRTPWGAFMTYDKQRDKTLRGDKQPDGSWGYETFVSYWIRLTNTGVGLHDAPWRHGRFGGNIWINSGSHGCVNLPPASAAKIYEIVPEKTPVAIYY